MRNGGAAARAAPAGCRRGASIVFVKFTWSPGVPVGFGLWTSTGPPPDWRRRYGPLPSKPWPAPASVDEAVEELVEVRLAGAELGVGGDRRVGGRDQVLGRAARERGQLREAASSAPALAWARPGAAPFSSRASPPSSLAWTSCAGLVEPRVEGVDRVGQLLDSRAGVDRQRAQRRQRVVEVGERRARAFSSVGASSAIVSREVRRLGGERPGEGVEVGDQAAEVAARGSASFANTSRVATMNPARSSGFSPRSASLTIAVPRPGLAAVPERVVERLARASRRRRRGPGRGRPRRSAGS